MEDFLKELINLCQKHDIVYGHPEIRETMNHFSVPASITCTSFSGTSNTFHLEGKYIEITKKMNITFTKKTKRKV